MAVLFETLKAGLVLYDCSKERMGNLTVQVLKVRSIRVLEVNATAQRALISWNGNPPAWKSLGFFKSPNIRRSPPNGSTAWGKTLPATSATKPKPKAMPKTANILKLSGMLTLQTYNYRIVQTGPRTYYAERWEFARWWRSDPTELLETYPKTVEEAMWEDWRAVSREEPEVIRTP